MWYYVTKIVVSAALIVVISEIAKRSSMMGAVVASLPLVSIIAMVWLYHESGDTAKIIALSTDIFWLVLPSLVLFIALPMLLKYEVSFYLSLGISIILTVIAYLLMVTALQWFRG
jgi:uncharacterized membrane protein YesL